MLFGFKDWTLGSPRAHQDRIVGPFGSTHTTADYLIAQTILISYWLVHKTGGRSGRWLLLLLGLNLVCLIATGDRGGFVGIALGGVAFVSLFRREIGGFGMVKYSAVGAVFFVLASFVVVEYTEFGRLYERLEQTDISIEDHARASIFERGEAWFRERPIVGRGPKLNVSSRNAQIGDIEYRGALPHNLYLTILASTGILGLIAWTLFLISVLIPLFQALRRNSASDPRLANIPKLGLLIILLFLLGEIRIEFLRQEFFDYQNYIFVLLALFVACSHLILREVRYTAAKSPESPPLSKLQQRTVAGAEDKRML
jgi:O-antigen ligase